MAHCDRGNPSSAAATASASDVVFQATAQVLVARSLAVAAELGIADLLGDGPKDAAELARATGASEDSVYRLLRMLASHGVFRENEDGSFALTPSASVLQSDATDSLRNYLRIFFGDVGWNAFGHLLPAVMSGRCAFEVAYGSSYFSYLQEHPDLLRLFSSGMAQVFGPENAALAEAYDFGRFGRVVDVGGGAGRFLAAVLEAHPTVLGVLYDQPDVVAHPSYLQAADVLDRCEIVAGDFFASVPAGGDAYVLKRIVHDWDDDEAVAILRRCREAAGSDGRVLTIEGVVRACNEPDPAKDRDLWVGIVLIGGRERTEAEFRDLYRRAGLQVTRIVAAPPSTLSMIEGVAV